jgi:8-oxo-dGTP diphosphatase
LRDVPDPHPAFGHPFPEEEGKAVEVAAGILTDPQGRVLLMQRLPGKHLAGLWEFPGGKVEPGETIAQALVRELDEELGIEVLASTPLISIPWHYPEKSVRLHALRVTAWNGEPRAREGHPLRWVPVRDMDAAEMPAADAPILAALRLPPYYVISQGSESFFGHVDSTQEPESFSRHTDSGTGRLAKNDSDPLLLDPFVKIDPGTNGTYPKPSSPRKRGSNEPHPTWKEHGQSVTRRSCGAPFGPSASPMFASASCLRSPALLALRARPPGRLRRSLAMLAVAGMTASVGTALEQGPSDLGTPFLLRQLRRPGATREQLRQAAESIIAADPAMRASLLLNHDIELARELGVGVQLRAAQLRELRERPLSPGAWVGASCHDAEELDLAARLGADFATLSPVNPTASHPEATPLGWERFAQLVADARLPVYALGGVGPDDLQRARAAGAQGVAGIRAFR